MSAQILDEEDLRFWIAFSHSHENWRKAWEAAAYFDKLFPAKTCHYKPWLVVVRDKLLRIEKSNHPILSEGPQSKDLALYIHDVVQWLSHKSHRNLLKWLLGFLFYENSEDTKRPFLFIQGPPNSGKTFFIDILAPPQDAGFNVKNRTFAHFGSEKPGNYELHLLLFDDPGEVKGRNNQLDLSIILNMANKNMAHSLPVKFGFMNLKKGQIAIISNRTPSEMFPSDSVEAIQTRLLTMEFTLENPFPLKGESHLSNPFLYNEEIELDVEDMLPPSEMNFIYFDGNDEEENEAGGVEQEEAEEQAFAFQPQIFEKDLLFYILWRAIFKLLKVQLCHQSLSTLKYYIPNHHLRSLIRNKEVNCIYEIICQRLTEDELLKILSS